MNEPLLNPIEEQSDPEHSIISLFKALESNTDLEQLNSFGKSTPKFSLKDTHKICKMSTLHKLVDRKEFLAV